MAHSLEELIILKRTALKYLLIRESRLLALGKKPINKKIATFIRTHQENSVWSSFLDSLNEDLTRNINVFEWKSIGKPERDVKRRSYRLDSVTRDTLKSYEKRLWGGRMEEAPVVKVEQGQLQGRIASSPSGKAFYSFQGVPYAKPPLGTLRFKDPVPAEPWEGIRDATSEGNVSPQHDKTGALIGDENCLFLNVYTPNLDGAFLPVMFYIHGGGLRNGSGNASSYGADFLVEKDVVVVTVNYRLGALGFLCLNTPEVPGNAGLKDQCLALKWVKENIHKFGGNAGNITVFGQSAGGVCASVLTASPLVKNDISKAIVQSGVALGTWSWQQTPLDYARVLAKQVGCEATDVDEILDYLQATSPKEILEATDVICPLLAIVEKGVNFFSLVIEKEFPGVQSVVNESFLDILTTGRTVDVPILTGVADIELAKEITVDDLSAFLPAELNIERNSPEALAAAEKFKELYLKGQKLGVETWTEYCRLFSDTFFNVHHHRYIQHLTKVSNKPVYFYNFAYVGNLNISKKLGIMACPGFAAHSDELGYIFKCDEVEGVEPTSKDVQTRERMVSLWTNFAKTGNPTPDENHLINVTWQPATQETEYYLNIGSELSVETNLHGDKMAYWDELYNKYFKIWEQPRSNANEVPEKAVFKPNVVEQTVAVVEQTVAVVEETVSVVEEKVEEIKDKPEEIEANGNSVEEETTPEVKSVEVNTQEKEEDNTHEEKETETAVPEVVEVESQVEIIEEVKKPEANGHLKLNGDSKPRPSNEVKMVQSNGTPKDVIRANDPPEDDLPKNIGVNKFVNFFESLGGKK